MGAVSTREHHYYSQVCIFPKGNSLFMRQDVSNAQTGGFLGGKPKEITIKVGFLCYSWSRQNL